MSSGDLSTTSSKNLGPWEKALACGTGGRSCEDYVLGSMVGQRWIWRWEWTLDWSVPTRPSDGDAMVSSCGLTSSHVVERRNCLYLLSLQARNVHSYLLGFCCPNLYNIYIYGMLGMYSMQGVRPWSNREMAQQAISTTPRSSTAKVWVRNLTNLYAAKFICQLSGSYHHMISPLHHPAPSSQISSSCQTQTTSFSWVPLLHLFLVDALMHLLTQLLDTHSY